MPSASRLSVPLGGINEYPNHYSYPSSSPLSSNQHPLFFQPIQYLIRLTDMSQMDIQSTFDQMSSLLSPTQIHKVYKMAYYRKQTKNHWARDDPAFITVQIILMIITCFAYCVAFHDSTADGGGGVSDGLWIRTVRFAFLSIAVNYGLFGMIVSTICWTIANSYLTNNGSLPTTTSSKTTAATIRHSSAAVSSSRRYIVGQSVEWLYSFDIHCNAFFPLFMLIYVGQYFLLPLVLGRSLLALIVSNLMYGIAFGWYFYVTHLGYRALPFLSSTEVFLLPIAVVVFLLILNFIGYPFGFGWNASRIFANLYF